MLVIYFILYNLFIHYVYSFIGMKYGINFNLILSIY